MALRKVCEDWLAAFDKHFKAGDIKTLAEKLYTPDCTMMAPGHQIKHGAEGIAEVLTQLKKDGAHSAPCRIEHVEGNDSETVLYFIGLYSLCKEDGSTLDKGKFTIVMKPTGGWRTRVVCFCSDNK